MNANVFESQKYALNDRLNNLRQSYVTLLTDVSQNKMIHFQPIVISHPDTQEQIEIFSILNAFVFDIDEDMAILVDDISSIHELDAIVKTIELNKIN